MGATDLLRSALAIARMQDSVILHLDLLPHHHQRGLLGARAQLELHLQPAELPLHILDARVVVGYTPACDVVSLGRSLAQKALGLVIQIVCNSNAPDAAVLRTYSLKCLSFSSMICNAPPHLRQAQLEKCRKGLGDEQWTSQRSAPSH